MTRVFLYTFGCKANQYDTEVLRQALEAVGLVTASVPADADIAIVNSCTVTHVSEAKMRGLVRRVSRENPELSSLLVIGCAATLDLGAIESIPGVSAVVGGTDPHTVLEALGLSADGLDTVLRSFERGSRAWLKIQDGCDERCTYCATRFARGACTSRVPEEVLREAVLLAERHSEIVLTGVHIGNYGYDLPGRPKLSALVSMLVAQVPSVRFRLSSVEATQLDEELIELMDGAPDRLAPHVHAPLQSGSDRMLRLMGRRWYNATSYRKQLETLAKRMATLGLGADVIVGFPGETDTDFEATRSLIDALPFTYLHVFPYSPRPNTAALKLGPPAEPEVTKRRSSELRALAEAKHAAYVASRHEGPADVVLIRREGERHEGLTEDYLSTYTPSETVLPGRLPATLQYRDGALWAVPRSS